MLKTGKTKRSCRRVSMSAIRTPASLRLLDRFYREFNVAVGRAHRDFIGDAVAHQRLAERAFVRDAAFLRVGFGSAYDGEYLGAPLALLLDLDLIAQADHVLRALPLDHLRVAQDRFKAQDFAFDKSLLVFGVLILCVLDEFAAFLQRLMQPCCNFLPPDVAKKFKALF